MILGNNNWLTAARYQRVKKVCETIDLANHHDNLVYQEGGKKNPKRSAMFDYSLQHLRPFYVSLLMPNLLGICKPLVHTNIFLVEHLMSQFNCDVAVGNALLSLHLSCQTKFILCTEAQIFQNKHVVSDYELFFCKIKRWSFVVRQIIEQLTPPCVHELRNHEQTRIT